MVLITRETVGLKLKGINETITFLSLVISPQRKAGSFMVGTAELSPLQPSLLNAALHPHCGASEAPPPAEPFPTLHPPTDPSPSLQGSSWESEIEPSARGWARRSLRSVGDVLLSL